MYIIGSGTEKTWFDTNVHHVDSLPYEITDGKRRCESSYGNYSSLTDALEACKEDANCPIVYNSNCADESFSFCTRLEKLPLASSKSCIYEKRMLQFDLKILDLS